MEINIRHVLVFALCLVVLFVGIDLMMKKPTVSVSHTRTQVFSGQTAGEALAEWKADFPGRNVIKWKIGLSEDGLPVELEIWYR